MPQGSRLGPCLFAIVYDKVLQTPLPEGVTIVCYADDLAVIGPVGCHTTETRLQRGILAVESALRNLGLCLNASKSQVLVASFKGYVLQRPLSLRDGEPIPEVKEARYLGITLDRTLQTDQHWESEANTIRSLAGSIHRVCQGNKRLERIAVKGLIEGRLNYGLPCAPPSKQSTWNHLASSMALAGRYLLNEWSRQMVVTEDGEFLRYRQNGGLVIASAGLSHPKDLHDRQSLRFLYQAVH